MSEPRRDGNEPGSRTSCYSDLPTSQTDYEVDAQATPVSDLGRPAGPTPTPTGGDAAPEFVAGTPEVGQVLFGKYVVEGQLGQGGMGSVWLVRHQTLGILRALKMILSGISIDQGIRRRFRREARVMASLQHPNAVQVHDALIAADAAFIDMEYVPGDSVDKLMRPGVPMPLDWVARILSQLCDVLGAAHDLGIVHRDLSPSNLMLLSGRPPGYEFLKVLDFGIAKILVPGEGGDDREEMTLTAPFSFLGKPLYASPEQVEGREIDGRSDLYTVGVMLYEFLTGHRPFSGKRIKLLYDHGHAPPPPFAEINPTAVVPDAIERLVMRCLAKLPEDRPATAYALAEEFLRCITGTFEMPGTWPPGPVEHPSALPTSPYAQYPPSPPRHTPSPSGQTAVTEAYNAQTQQATQAMTGASAVDRSGTWLMPVAPRRRAAPVALALGGVVVALTALGFAAVRFWPTPPTTPTTPPREVDPKTSSTRPPEVRHQLELWSASGFQEDEKAGTTPEGWPRALDSQERGRFVRDADGHYLPERYAMVSQDGYAEDGWPRTLERDDGVRFVRIPAPAPDGTFTMGVDDEFLLGGSAFPAHEVKLLDGYYLQQYEVTNGELGRYLDAGREVALESLTQNWRYWMTQLRQVLSDPDQINQHPACDVSRQVAQMFAHWVGGELPTEAQWEYAARSGPRQNSYVWGAQTPRSTTEMANLSRAVDSPIPTVAMSGSGFGEPGRDRTEQGVVGMAGNVSEWCRDEYRKYPSGRRVDPPALPSGRDADLVEYVVRGGSFDTSIDLADVRARAEPCQGTRSRRDVGFRVVLDCPAAGPDVTRPRSQATSP